MKAVSLTVVLAFFANLVVALAKTIAAVLSGSASMTAEAAHSWADTGNEIFLLIADRRGMTRRDADHPLGYGKETYFWSTIAAFGLFTAGAALSVIHGVQQLAQPERSGEFWIDYLVLGVSAIFEGVSFAQALRSARAAARKRSRPTLAHVLESSNPTLRAVFAEDSAALIGLAIAAVGILLHQLTGSAIYDAVGSILIGLLLGGVAVVLIERNRRFLVGQVTSPALTDIVLHTLLDSGEIERVTYIHVEFVGPDRVYLVAAIDLTGDDRETRVAERLKNIGAEIEQDDRIEQAVLTLSTPDQPSLVPSS